MVEDIKSHYPGEVDQLTWSSSSTQQHQIKAIMNNLQVLKVG